MEPSRVPATSLGEHIKQFSLVKRGHDTLSEDPNDGKADATVNSNVAVRDWEGCC